ncbi:MAG: hypothetical protein WAP55_00990 [Minisyncoccia bacterium]
MEGRESSGPSPEDMNFKSPESQPAEAGKESAGQVETTNDQAKDPKRWVHSFNRPEQADKQPESKDTDQVETGQPLIELYSFDVGKYEVGQMFDNGKVRGTIEKIDPDKSAIYVRPEQVDKQVETPKPLVELLSTNVLKYKVGEIFDNGKVRGEIKIIDYSKGSIFVEEAKEGGGGNNG